MKYIHYRVVGWQSPFCPFSPACDILHETKTPWAQEEHRVKSQTRKDTEHVYLCNKNWMQYFLFHCTLVVFPRFLEARLGCLTGCQQATSSPTQLGRWSPGNIKILIFPPFYLKTSLKKYLFFPWDLSSTLHDKKIWSHTFREEKREVQCVVKMWVLEPVSGFTSWSHHLLPVFPRVSYWIFLCLHFLTYTMG